jgi:hypothetical protein
VDFWVFGFDIYFGDDAASSLDFDLHRFANLLLQQSATAGEDIPTVETSRKTHVYALQVGAFPSKKDKKTDPVKPDDGKPWRVRGDGMVFRIHSRFAISQATMEKETAVPNKPGGSIGSRPMRLITDNSFPIDQRRTIDSQVNIVCVNKDATQPPPEGFTLAPVMKDVPRAIWGSCKYRDVLRFY